MAKFCRVCKLRHAAVSLQSVAGTQVEMTPELCTVMPISKL